MNCHIWLVLAVVFSLIYASSKNNDKSQNIQPSISMMPKNCFICQHFERENFHTFSQHLVDHQSLKPVKDASMRYFSFYDLNPIAIALYKLNLIEFIETDVSLMRENPNFDRISEDAVCSFLEDLLQPYFDQFQEENKTREDFCNRLLLSTENVRFINLRDALKSLIRKLFFQLQQNEMTFESSHNNNNFLATTTPTFHSDSPVRSRQMSHENPPLRIENNIQNSEFLQLGRNNASNKSQLSTAIPSLKSFSIGEERQLVNLPIQTKNMQPSSKTSSSAQIFPKNKASYKRKLSDYQKKANNKQDEFTEMKIDQKASFPVLVSKTIDFAGRKDAKIRSFVNFFPQDNISSKQTFSINVPSKVKKRKAATQSALGPAIQKDSGIVTLNIDAPKSSEHQTTAESTIISEPTLNISQVSTANFPKPKPRVDHDAKMVQEQGNDNLLAKTREHNRIANNQATSDLSNVQDNQGLYSSRVCKKKRSSKSSRMAEFQSSTSFPMLDQFFATKYQNDAPNTIIQNNTLPNTNGQKAIARPEYDDDEHHYQSFFLINAFNGNY